MRHSAEYREALWDLAIASEAGTVPPCLLDEQRAQIMARFNVSENDLRQDVAATVQSQLNELALLD